MFSRAPPILVDLVGEASGFELAVLTTWAVLGVLLGLQLLVGVS